MSLKHNLCSSHCRKFTECHCHRYTRHAVMSSQRSSFCCLFSASAIVNISLKTAFYNVQLYEMKNYLHKDNTSTLVSYIAAHFVQ